MPSRNAVAPAAATPARQPLPLDQQLCFALYAASLAMTRRYQPLLAELGLTYPQYVTLLALWEQDDLTVSALGERVALDSGTLTPLLKRMAAAGWLERLRDPDDERRVRIRLSPAGQALRQRASQVPAALLAGSGVTPAQVRRLTGELQDLRQRLGA